MKDLLSGIGSIVFLLAIGWVGWAILQPEPDYVCWDGYVTSSSQPAECNEHGGIQYEREQPTEYVR